MVGAPTFRIDPPRLRTLSEPGEERHATWFELYFDLVFAAAVAQLANALSRDPSGPAFARFVGLFVVVAWAWMGFVFYANRFDTDDLIYRLAKSCAMLAIAAIAVNLPRVIAEAFEFLGGVPELVRYDNLSSAVKKVLKGRRRIESDRFVALRSHYLFESQFTIIGIDGAHEKGGIENEVGRFRRRHLVPVLKVKSLKELNAHLRAGCEADLDRRIAGQERTVAEALAAERALLHALPFEPAPTAEEATPRVDAKAMVTVRQNRYSVPVSLVGHRVLATIGARTITVSHGGETLAIHDRLPGRFGVSAQLDHYLELLVQKPGALAGSLALHQERRRGHWPKCLDELWGKLTERYGPSEAARQMVDVLLLAREHSPARLELAVRGALAAGAHDGRAVGLLVRQTERPTVAVIEDLPEHLAVHERAEPTLCDYDRLLVGVSS